MVAVLETSPKKLEKGQGDDKVDQRVVEREETKQKATGEGERKRKKKQVNWECGRSGERETEIIKASCIQYFLFKISSLLQRST